MATLISVVQVQPAIANARTTFVVTVSNTGAVPLSLSSLDVSDPTKRAIVAAPNFLTANVPAGTGNPTISAAGTFSTSFGVIFPSPNTPGPSPNTPGPLGVAGMFLGQPANASYTLLVQCQTSDGSVASTSIVVPVLSATAPFPRPEGGALQFSQGSNLINGIIMGVL